MVLATLLRRKPDLLVLHTKEVETLIALEALVDHTKWLSYN